MFPSPQTRGYKCHVEYVHFVRRAMRETNERAKEHMEVAASRQKRTYDGHAKDQEFKIDGTLNLIIWNIVSLLGLFLVYGGYFMEIQVTSPLTAASPVNAKGRFHYIFLLLLPPLFTD